ncbi:protocatechuate 3,4-dioxygenase [Pandoraea pneumonica]|uniref:DODA-type extradiol aromatic ring-opening family dioxygenase n=1 Tax=Pandoraea pneumonica TaxID=2508299 RepID=UPI003CEFAB2B
MTKIVLAVGTSHGPMLSTPPADWDLRVRADRAELAHPFRGQTYSFDELMTLRASEDLEAQVTLPAREAHAARCNAALEVLSQALHDAAPDVVVIVGNDQREVFGPAITPALWLYGGESVFDEPVSAARLAKMPPGISISSAAIKPGTRTEYPAHAPLARHLATAFTEYGHDITLSTEVPQRGNDGPTGMPHAFGFVYQRLMHGRVPPHVPIMLNTFYPPNRPRATRCVDLGLALHDALSAWPDDVRVALIASGGLSHFVIDEDFDRALLDAMARGDNAYLRSIDETLLQSGTSEVKNWLPVIAAANAEAMTMQLVDYVPCYRSAAGTGNAMGFVLWHPAN